MPTSHRKVLQLFNNENVKEEEYKNAQEIWNKFEITRFLGIYKSIQ